MNYPLIRRSFPHGAELLIPDPTRVKETYERLLAFNPATPFPYWARVWPASTALSNYLHQYPYWIREKKVLEIGAGIGSPSFAIASMAGKIVITDNDPEAVELARENIRRSGLTNVTAHMLDWGQLPDDLAAEVVLLSDVNYDPDQFGNLMHMMDRFLAEGSTLVLSTPQRITASRFMDVIGPHVKASAQMTIHEEGRSTEVSISVLSL